MLNMSVMSLDNLSFNAAHNSIQSLGSPLMKYVYLHCYRGEIVHSSSGGRGANKIQSNKCNKCCRISPMNTNLQMVMQSLCPYFDASMLPFEFREWMGSSLVPPFDNNFSIT